MTTIGASEIAVTVGLQQRRRDGTPYTSELELWARCRGLVPRYDSETSPAAEAGRTMELGIGVRAGRELGWDVVPGPQLPDPGWVHPEIPWLAVRPDFAGYLDSRPAGLVECKAPRELDETWGATGTGDVPVHYAVQAMAQLAVVARQHPEVTTCYVAAHARDARWGDRVWGLHPIVRDVEVESRLLVRAHDWYRRHVEDGTPPLGDGSQSATDTLARIWRPANDYVEATPDDVERWHRLLSVRSAIDDLYAERRELEQSLQLRMREATEIVHDGRRLATWRPRLGASRIDTTRLRRERPDVAREFTIEAEDGRTFRLETPR